MRVNLTDYGLKTVLCGNLSTRRTTTLTSVTVGYDVTVSRAWAIRMYTAREDGPTTYHRVRRL